MSLLGRATIALFVLVLFPKWVSELPAPREAPPILKPSKVSVSAEAGRKGPPKYLFALIEQKIKKHKGSMASCLWLGVDDTVVRLGLQLNWQANGFLKSVATKPETNHKTKSCVKDLVQSWQIDPHPALQPYSYFVDIHL